MTALHSMSTEVKRNFEAKVAEMDERLVPPQADLHFLHLQLRQKVSFVGVVGDGPDGYILLFRTSPSLNDAKQHQQARSPGAIGTRVHDEDEEEDDFDDDKLILITIIVVDLYNPSILDIKGRRH
ncbi:uncharacterized protein PgNI_09307 [Pyricularia grisea]|uniref:Uncharacterized protein n=1 Tax=Pyricularia grisea TaxID=148305 RepID=A0A6P8ASR3_PYRGI|nr:uncharacterized protein PgNI_09307 [Pyricularia grisea]TLD05165.1 hypothetical protein PgNI_09307 [Pyricularia grisea]